MVVLRQVDCPLGLLAAHLHHDAQGFEDLVVALQADGHVVVAHSHQRVYLEAEGPRLQGGEGVGGETVDHSEPLRHII